MFQTEGHYTVADGSHITEYDHQFQWLLAVDRRPQVMPDISDICVRWEVALKFRLVQW